MYCWKHTIALTRKSSSLLRCAAPILGRYTVFVRTGLSHHNLLFVRARRVVLIAAASVAAGACEKPLFAPDSARSQYERYDAIRGQNPPAYVEDEFGRRHPNLRGRLTTKQ